MAITTLHLRFYSPLSESQTAVQSHLRKMSFPPRLFLFFSSPYFTPPGISVAETMTITTLSPTNILDIGLFRGVG